MSALNTRIVGVFRWAFRERRVLRMKRVDMDTVVVVHSGEQWEHEQPPCSRQMIRYLEKNEGLVTWVQVDLLLSWRVSGGRLI